LLFDPGLGKTATALDFISLLSLKSPEMTDSFGRQVREARVLVIAPLAAIDTWVLQSEKWVAEGVNYWAEALGGTILQRAEALAARGGQPFLDSVSKFIGKAQENAARTGEPVDWHYAVRKGALFLRQSGVEQARAVPALKTKFSRAFPDENKASMHEYIEQRCAVAWKMPLQRSPRALHNDKSLALSTRAEARGSERPLTPSEGPDGLGPDRPRFVLLATNFDTFSSRQKVKGTEKQMADHLLEAVRRFNPDLVVVDEAHKIKSATSNVSRLLGRIGEIVPRRMALTGTIMPAGPLDVFGVWRFLEPFAFGEQLRDGTRKRATFAAFKEKYAVMGGYMGREVKGYKNLDEMQNIMAINSVVARKRDELKELPKDQDVEVPILLTPQELKAYKEMKKGLATELQQAVGGTSTASAGSRLTQMLRLRQITAGHLPDDMGNMHILGSSKADAVDSLVNDTLVGENRVVVFCYFRHEIDVLGKKLARAGTEIMKIDGETHPDVRLQMRKRFGDESVTERIVMIAQIRTMSLAVNELVTASNAVFATLPQTRDDIVQARDRLNRLGQKLPTTFWFVLAPGTVDTVIFQSYKDKTSLEEAVLAHILDLDPETAEEIEFIDEASREAARA